MPIVGALAIALAPGALAYESLDEAVADAARMEKPLLVDFYTEW
jgi:hypothetical protein